MTLGSWFSSGTLAPYATTLPAQFIRQTPEGYPANLDHAHFQQVDLMIGGYPKENWSNSHYLRRVLYSIAARPLTASLGFLYGGVLFNVLLSLFAFYLYRRFLEHRFKPSTSKWGLWLLALYPGIFYWIGLPYHHASIVPLCLIQFFLMSRFYEDQQASGKNVWMLFLLFGVLGLSYDLLPIFAGSLALLVIEKKLWRFLPTALPLALLPSILVNRTLSLFVETENANSKIIPTIIKSYANWSQSDLWWKEIKEVPRVLFLNFFDSNFWTLPSLFLLFLIFSHRVLLNKSYRPALYLLITIAGLFFFNNLAPPYPGWQLRGTWIARIYQPMFVPLIMFVLISFDELRKNTNRLALMRTALALTVILNVWTIFGGITGAPQLSNLVYHRFYMHSPKPVYSENLKKLGRRPLGF